MVRKREYRENESEKRAHEERMRTEEDSERMRVCWDGEDKEREN